MRNDEQENLGDGWIDVTRAILDGMVHWPGDPEVEVNRVSDMNKGDICNLSRVVMGVHAGTHIDGPVHFLKDGDGVETAPFSPLMGRARVIQIKDEVCIRRSELEQHDIREGERIIFRTRNVDIPWETEFCMDFVYVGADAARYLAEKKVALVGVDYMSVGGFYHDIVETHVALLEAGIWIVENLDLRTISTGDWELICLPMKIVGSDGAPVRALMRPVKDH